MSNMATVSTCSKCGLSYRDSLIPHECAEWTKGRKEAKETQPMSDTLPEREDQMDQHQSATCTIPECPCREWSSQIAAAENSRQRREAIKLSQAVARAESAAKEVTDQTATTTHQPAARGGGEGVKVELINGVEGQCVAVNDYRICGPKPWGGGSIAKSWTTDKNDVLRAFLTPDQKHAWLADELEVVSVNQHQALVAERESYAQLLKAAKSLIAMNNCNYGRSAMRERGGFIELEKAVETVEQRSTSA